MTDNAIPAEYESVIDWVTTNFMETMSEMVDQAHDDMRNGENIDEYGLRDAIIRESLKRVLTETDNGDMGVDDAIALAHCERINR